MTPVILLTDGFIANGSEPWRIPSMKDYPAIQPPIVDDAPEGGFMPYVRDEKLARGWAFPGKVGLEHRVGGLEKDCVKGCISHDPSNHQKMVSTRAAKVAKAADDIPAQTVWGDPEGDLLVVGWGGTRGHLQNAVHQAEEFNKAAELTGIILTKLDGTAKGGIVIAISAGLGVPVKLVGVGEGIDDLIDFDRAAFLEAILPPAEQMTGDSENEEEGAEQE